MPRLPRLFSVFLFAVLTGCAPAASPDSASASPVLVHLQSDPSGTLRLVARSGVSSPASALPFTLPANCSVYRLHPNPAAPLLGVEFACGERPAALVYDLQSGETVNPAEEVGADVRLLDWSANGRHLYLKADPLGSPQVVRYDRLRNRLAALSLPGNVYNLAALPDGRILYSITYGLGFGSETWLAEADGSRARRVLSRPLEIVAYLRPSPDGSRVAFILLPDSQTPFPDGELWLMEADGSDPRFLAAADAGRGYAPAWSPDGTQIAFVVRQQGAGQAGTLFSNVHRLEVRSGAQAPVTAFDDAVVETPAWSPDGTALFFNVVRNGTIQVWFEVSGTLQPLGEGVSCCAAWVPGR